MLGLLLAACTEGGKTSTTAPVTTTPTEPLPTFTVALADPSPVPVGCLATRDVLLQNNDTVDHVVETVTWRTRSDQILLDLLEFDGAVVHPGGTTSLPLRVTPEVAESAVLTLDLAWEEDGAITHDLPVDIGWADLQTRTETVTAPLVDVMLLVDPSVVDPAARATQLRRGLPDWLGALEGLDWRISLVRGDDRCVTGPFADRQQAVDVIGDTAFDGTPGADSEALLRLASYALAENAPTECNADFLRPGSQLQLVVLSDEGEQSGRPWTWWREDWTHYADLTVVSGIVDLSRCNAGAANYSEAVNATDGVAIDVCDPGWGDDLARLADAVVELPPRFPVEGEVVASSVVAEVDGEEVGARWDDERGQIVLDELWPVGTEVTLHWSPPAACE